MMEKKGLLLYFHSNMRTLFTLLLALTSASVLAVDETWNYQNDFTRRITSYNLAAPTLNINAEVVDYNLTSLGKKPGLDQYRAVLTRKQLSNQFQAEIQGMRNLDGPESQSLFSYLRHRSTLFHSDEVTLSFQSQIFALKDDTRSAFGVPLDYRINSKHAAGISFLIEQGRYSSAGPLRKKEMLNIYYNYRFFQGLSCNMGFYGEKKAEISGMSYSQINSSLQYQPNDKVKINLGTYVSQNAGPVAWNHVLGATVSF